MIHTIEDIISRFPDNIAVIFNNGDSEKRLTYKKLGDLATEIDTFLVDVDEFEVIGVALNSEEDCFVYLIPCLLAILRRKCAFHVIDTKDQSARSIENSVKNASIRFILCDQSFRNYCKSKISSFNQWVLQEIVTSPPTTGLRLARTNIPKNPKIEDHSLYVVSTSGTTGYRKTVFVPESSIGPNIKDLCSAFEIGSDDRLFMASPPTFDPFCVDFFCAVTTAATMIFVSASIKAKPERLAGILRKSRPTIGQMTPTLYSNLMPHLESWLISSENSFRVLALGGEPFPKVSTPLLAKLDFYNLYGQTEMSCWQSAVRVTTTENPIPIAKIGFNLLSETEVKLLNSEEGKEIVLSSRTRKCKIVEEDGRTNRQLEDIRTGDLGYIEDGYLYFVGRKDDIVKLYGKRISIVEVERELSNAVNAECVCVVQNGVISAFVKSSEDLTPTVKSAVSSLPSHMRPTSFQFMEAFPITENGKVNKRRLTKMLDDGNEKCDVMSLWTRFTGSSPKDHSNFIDDGGDSVMAVLLAQKLDRKVDALTDCILNKTYKDVLNLLEETLEPSAKIARLSPEFGSTRKENLPTEKLISEEDLASFCRRGFHRGEISNELCVRNFKFLERWKIDLGKCIDASPLVVLVQGTLAVFVGSHKGVLVSSNLETGTINWKIYLPDRIESAAAVSDNGKLIFVGCYDGRLYGLDIATGAIRWSFATSGIVKCSPVTARGRGKAEGGAHGVVIFGSYDHHAYCLCQETGKLIWKVRPSEASITSSPVVIERDCVLSTLDGTVLKVDVTTGQSLWSRRLHSPIFSSPTSSNTAAFVGCADGSITALQLVNGITKWRSRQSENPIFSSMTLSDGGHCILFGSHDNAVHCLAAETGRKLWKHQLSAAVFATPFTVRCTSVEQDLQCEPCISTMQSVDCVISVSTDGNMKVLDVTNGNCVQESKLKVRGEIFSSPVCVSSKIIVGCRDNFLYCFE